MEEQPSGPAPGSGRKSGAGVTKPHIHLAQIEEFVDLVPELQRRDRYRRDYAGTTRRDHLMQER
jgi:hypothetical protein